jgi:hypothetical protein
MGRGWGGVESPETLSASLTFTPTHEQVRAAPQPAAVSGGHGDLLISPIKGEGFWLNVDTT